MWYVVVFDVFRLFCRSLRCSRGQRFRFGPSFCVSRFCNAAGILFLGYSGVLPLSGLVSAGRQCGCNLPGRPSLARGRPESVACVPSIPPRIWASESPNRSRPGADRTPRAIRAADSSCGPNCAFWVGSWAEVPAGRCPAAASVLWLARVSVRLPIRWACVCLGLRGFRGALAGRDDASVGPWPAASRRRCPESRERPRRCGVGMPACWGCRPVASGWPGVAVLSAAAAPLRASKVCAASSDSAAREAWPLPQRLSI